MNLFRSELNANRFQEGHNLLEYYLLSVIKKDSFIKVSLFLLHVRSDNEIIKYHGVTITNDLNPRRTQLSCPQDVKEAAYKGMVRPVLIPKNFKINKKKFKIVRQGL